MLYCHVKEGDTVLVAIGKYSKTISKVSEVIRITKKNSDEFKLVLESLPKKTLKKRGSNSTVEKNILIHASNVTKLDV